MFLPAFNHNLLFSKINPAYATILRNFSDLLFKCALTAHDVKEAFGLLKEIAPSEKKVVVTGSFYLVGEARKLLK